LSLRVLRPSRSREFFVHSEGESPGSPKREQADRQYIEAAHREAIRNDLLPIREHDRCRVAGITLESPGVNSVLAAHLRRIKALHLDSHGHPLVVEKEVALLLSIMGARTHQIRYAGAKKPLFLELVFRHEAKH